ICHFLKFIAENHPCSSRMKHSVGSVLCEIPFLHIRTISNEMIAKRSKISTYFRNHQKKFKRFFTETSETVKFLLMNVNDNGIGLSIQYLWYNCIPIICSKAIKSFFFAASDYHFGMTYKSD